MPVAKYKIVDPSKINDTFWVIDEQAIAALVRTKKLDAKQMIGEGIEIWMEADISVRTR